MECYKIPIAVRKAAKQGLELRRQGFLGGTPTGWRRARQLTTAKCLPFEDAKVMKAWFARHGPSAKNGGTSYPGYKRWVASGRPRDKLGSRAAVAWLLWGSTPALRWISKLRLS